MSSNYIKRINGKGRGVFSGRRYHKGDVIEIAEVLVIPNDDEELVLQTFLKDYIYDNTLNSVVIGLGHSSLYNHSNTPNAYFEFNKNGNKLRIIANKTIQKDQEISIDYGWSEYEWEN